jgi:hypothetical protein
MIELSFKLQFSNFPVSHFVKLSYNVFSAHIHNLCEHGSWSNHTTFLRPLLLFLTFWVYNDEPSWATDAHATMKQRDRCTGRHILNTLVLYYYLFVFVTYRPTDQINISIMSCCNTNFYMPDLLLKPMQLFKFSKLETSVM